MSPRRFALGRFAYRPRHARSGVRWPLPALRPALLPSLLLATTVAFVTTGTNAATVILVALAALAALAILASLARDRLVSAATRIDRILAEERDTHLRTRDHDEN